MEVVFHPRLGLIMLLKYGHCLQVKMKCCAELVLHRNSSDRVKYWPSVNIALDGLRIHKDTINRCKKFVLQASCCPAPLMWPHSLFVWRVREGRGVPIRSAISYAKQSQISSTGGVKNA